ncbi:alpha/beta hydrolase [Bacillus sp. KH172YL63]|uniref:alpha/beta hydrolase n=1 Tax=Bacillus sp. KH172YL63 TaxID=2709784 RepID=UPI0013E5023D|nr:alpha/beta hydrolase [Bacillus sp. KH172YL63]BCB05715.1 hypothetical protein KH172YL63_38480 [Bacillus sp. KH172YL63]
MIPMDPKTISKNIDRTLKTAKLFDVFWERWLVHGVDHDDVSNARLHMDSAKEWKNTWERLAEEKMNTGKGHETRLDYPAAETAYKQASLYYYLNYWLDPMHSPEKAGWYKKCQQAMKQADSISNIPTIYKEIVLPDHSICSGRIRLPDDPVGVIISVNPIDSSKEELYQYEMDFAEKGFITLSFDGPGQGDTFLSNGVIGTRQNWAYFIDRLIDYAEETYGEFPLYLFGTSMAASWVLYGSSNRKVSKAVAVSPAVEIDRMNIPAYFLQRMKCSCVYDMKSEEETERLFPRFDTIQYHSPLLVFHGNKDTMISDGEMHRLFNRISSEKYLIEFEDQGHVCNHKLEEIRQISMAWFSGELKMKEELTYERE